MQAGTAASGSHGDYPYWHLQATRLARASNASLAAALTSRAS